jgi:carbon starvation protein
MDFHEGSAAVPAGTASEPRPAAGLALPGGPGGLVPGSSWCTFTIACTIPIALLVGLYMYRFRKGKVVEASLLGAVGVLAATAAGALIPGSRLEPFFSLSRDQTIVAIAAYGFIASVLPVWLLLCPRDYLSSFLKIGTIFLLVAGVILANPTLQAPPINAQFAHGGGPYFNGPIFPYVFICIMCGAISGFHALVASGTTPKMVDDERDIRMIGYGAMLMEGLVGIVALIAAAALPEPMYYDINIDLALRPAVQQVVGRWSATTRGRRGPGELVRWRRASRIAPRPDRRRRHPGRRHGADLLGRSPGPTGCEYWYHFAIMFEAPSSSPRSTPGTRIGRFMVRSIPGQVWKPLGDLTGGRPRSRRRGCVSRWAYVIWTVGRDDLADVRHGQPAPGVIALCVVTTLLINSGKARYAPATLLPMLFVASTTLTAAYGEMTTKYLAGPASGRPA